MILTWDIFCSSGLVVTGRLACFRMIALVTLWQPNCRIIEESAKISTFSSSKLLYGTLFLIGTAIADGALVKWEVKYGPGREFQNWKPGFKSTYSFWMKFNMNIHFDLISKYTFHVMTKTWFPVSKSPALVRVYNPFYQHSCWCRPQTGKYTREIISRTFCKFFWKFKKV